MSGMQAAEMWPRFEDGAPVDIGSEALLPGGTGGCKVFRVTVDECGWSAYGFGGRTAVGGVSTRVRRPPVLGKDGKAIEPGDAVWGEDGLNWLVTAIRWDKGNHIVEATARGEVKQLKPGWLTHEEPPKPVLDRYGVAIEVGDTVYVVGIGDIPYEVVDPRSGRLGGSVEIVSPGTMDGSGPGPVSTWFRPDDLTHERHDSWERLAEDAAKGACAYFGSSEFSCKECRSFGREHDCSGLMAMDIVRRAKALAGVTSDE